MGKPQHYQKHFGDMRPICGRATLYVGDRLKTPKNSTLFKGLVTCKYCIAAMEKVHALNLEIQVNP